MSTSKLQEYIYQKLLNKYPGEEIKINSRPEWLLSSDLKRLELDIYIPTFNVAIEVQGEQHYKFTPFFHKDYSEFIDRIRLDSEKHELCNGKGIYLFEVCQKSDIENIIEHINRHNHKDYKHKIHKDKKDFVAERRMIKSLRSPNRIQERSKNVAIYIFRMFRRNKFIINDALEYYKNNEDEVNKYLDEILSNLDCVKEKLKDHPSGSVCCPASGAVQTSEVQKMVF